MSADQEIVAKSHQSPASSLCSACEQIDLSPDASTPGISKLTQKTRRAIGKTPTCPFCRIAKASSGSTLKWSSKRCFFKDRPGKFGHGRDAERILFVDEHAERSPHLSGRVLHPQADIGLLKTWLRLCEDVHGDQCAPNPDVLFTPQSPRGLKAFRVVDVEDMCIADAQVGCRYLTLSYSWGKAQSPRLLKDNKTQLMTAHALEPLRGELPRTLRDAIDLVRRMGERYIWIDRLCLVQDDPEDMQHGIQKMDMVYEGAVLCIIAAAGEDGNAGLPGLHDRSRHITQHSEDIAPGLKMVEVGNLYQKLGGVYMSRGWTYQELLLPPRSLIFLDSCIYYRCSYVVWSEDTAYDKAPTVKHKNTGGSANIAVFRDKSMTPYQLFTSLVFRYSERELTKEGDALDAMAGLVSRIAQKLGSGVFQGLLTTHFDLCLLFYHPYIMPVVRRAEFPSWSWVGWKGPEGIWNPGNDGQPVDEWLATNRHIKWYQRCLQTGKVGLICEPDKSQAHVIAPNDADGGQIREMEIETASNRGQHNGKEEGVVEDEDGVIDGDEEIEKEGESDDEESDEGESDEEEGDEEESDGEDSSEEWITDEEDIDGGGEEEGDEEEGDDEEGDSGEGDDEGGGEKGGGEEVDEDEGSDSEETLGDLRTEPTDIPWKDIPYKYPALQFWTWTVLIPRLKTSDRGYAQIFSTKGLCGAVYFDDRQYGRDKSMKYEAALISKANRCKSIGDNWVQVPGDKPVYWFLLIDWKDIYAERKGVGFVYQSHIKHFLPPGRVWKEIVLV